MALEPEDLAKLYKTLSKSSEIRSKNEMLSAIPLIRSIKFFKDQEDSDEFTVNPDVYYLDIIKRLKYEFVPKHEIVFNMGEIGDRFYIILTGLVGIMVPTPKSTTNTDNQNQEDDEESLHESDLDDFTRECSLEVREKIKGYHEFVTLNDGKSFGEMALMSNKPRSATII